MTAAGTGRPQGAAGEGSRAGHLPREHTALIVVDMQNAYLHPEGSFARAFPHANNPEPVPIDPNDAEAAAQQFDLALLRLAIPGCRRLIDIARRAGIPVIYLRYVYRAEYRDGGVLIQEIRPDLAMAGYVAEGSWDAEIVDDLAPRPGDFVVDKPRYTGFHGSRLEPLLRSLRIENLVICGVGTHHCVQSTARDAHMRDYRTFIASDATGEANEVWKQTSLASFAYGFGWVLTTDEVARAWGVAA